MLGKQREAIGSWGASINTSLFFCWQAWRGENPVEAVSSGLHLAMQSTSKIPTEQSETTKDKPKAKELRRRLLKASHLSYFFLYSVKQQRVTPRPEKPGEATLPNLQETGFYIKPKVWKGGWIWDLPLPWEDPRKRGKGILCGGWYAGQIPDKANSKKQKTRAQEGILKNHQGMPKINQSKS